MTAAHRTARFARLTILAAASLLLAAFFAFVGYMKGFAPLMELAKHGAWTVHLPPPLGRAMGYSEMGCALLLLAGLARPAWGMWGAAILFVNQLAAAAVHMAMGETGALPQNAVILTLCVLIAWLQRARRAPLISGPASPPRDR